MYNEPNKKILETENADLKEKVIFAQELINKLDSISPSNTLISHYSHKYQLEIKQLTKDIQDLKYMNNDKENIQQQHNIKLLEDRLELCQ